MTSILKVDTIQNSTGTSTLTVPATTGTIATTNGITDFDVWSRTDTYTLLSSGDNVLTSNWTRVHAQMGTGMSQSSGVFTFPTTGYWLVKAVCSGYFNAGAVGALRIDIEATTDGGSTWPEVNRGIHGGSSAHWYSVDAEYFVDVTDTTQQKIRFTAFDQNGGAEMYFASGRDSVFQFIRIGDT